MLLLQFAAFCNATAAQNTLLSCLCIKKKPPKITKKPPKTKKKKNKTKNKNKKITTNKQNHQFVGGDLKSIAHCGFTTCYEAEGLEPRAPGPLQAPRGQAGTLPQRASSAWRSPGIGLYLPKSQTL